MSHSKVKIYVHIVFTVKNLLPLIVDDKSEVVYKVLEKEVEKTGSVPIIINGMPDHVHMLIKMSPTKSISQIVKQVKGGSSYLFDKKEWFKDGFNWQVGYGAFSVSYNRTSGLVAYIKNQKKHHQNKNNLDEMQWFDDL